MGDSFIIAIDFGTAYSGYAFNITSRDNEIDPYIKTWGEEVGLETPKTPTCILFDGQEEFISFGYQAKEDYLSKKGQEAREKYFFNCFKMALYGKKLTRNLKIKAANGKEMTALKVFTEALRFLKEDALKTIAKNTEGRKFKASDFTWVLTVPAIWDHSAKQFMREAATQAGLVTKGNSNKLIIALEPEAASVHCKKLPSDGFIAENRGEDKLDQSPGTQYIVVDCGGGTIDITVHEVLEGGALKELHKASGNDLGGQNVDRKFKEFLSEIFCDGVWDEYEQSYPSEVERMMNDFTVFKKKEKDIEVTCSLNLGRVAQKKQDIEKFLEKVQGVSYNDGSIRITKQKLRSFFEESLWGITESLRQILCKDFKIEYILLVGGFAESEILRRHITDDFIDNCKVLCPFRPQEVILKGAVEFGRKPHLVVSRKSAFTYGVAVNEEFDASVHSPDKKFTTTDGTFCADIFMNLVTADEDVGWDEIRNHILNPLESDQTQVNFTFFQTKKKKVNYVDEGGVEEIGSFVIQSPDITLGRKREIELEIKFGFTEMTATGTDKETGMKQTIELDFMRM
ncbi:heat shock 70 kDa protein 12A-like [Fundulus diaphanus]